ncbi:MAG: lysine decarboxylase, partial [Cyanobacteria bacterium P01_A01_bin.83]
PLSLILYPPQIPPREAYFAETETIPLKKAINHLCGELICPYPPGIPVLMPGEVITAEAINYLQQVLASGGTITGCNDPTLQTIQILKIDK